MYTASRKRDIRKQSRSRFDQELQFAYGKLYSKQNQNGTRQPLNDKWSRPVDKDGIFLGQYGLIVSLSVQNGFKSAFLVVLSLPR